MWHSSFLARLCPRRSDDQGLHFAAVLHGPLRLLPLIPCEVATRNESTGRMLGSCTAIRQESVIYITVRWGCGHSKTRAAVEFSKWNVRDAFIKSLEMDRIMHQDIETSLDSIESAHEFVALIAKDVGQTKHGIEDDIHRAVRGRLVSTTKGSSVIAIHSRPQTSACLSARPLRRRTKAENLAVHLLNRNHSILLRCYRLDRHDMAWPRFC